MRAAAFTELTGPDGVSIIEQPLPDPGSGEVTVDVEAVSINRHDLWILEGNSAVVDAADLPFVSGLDVAGTVREVGDGVDTVEPGDRVVLCPNETCGVCSYCRDGPETHCQEFSFYHGGLAEVALVPGDRLVPLPDGVSATDAAALPTAYLTAWRMLRIAETTPADLVFIPGVTGGVGVAAVQLCSVLGARSVGTSSSEAKLEAVSQLGLDYGIHSADPDEIRTQIVEIGSPDVVVNHLGGPFTELGLRVAARGGTMVICGRTAGNTGTVDHADLFLGHKRLLGSTMGTQSDLARLVELVGAGDLSPVVDDTYALEETAAAFRAMQNRESVGKLVVRP